MKKLSGILIVSLCAALTASAQTKGTQNNANTRQPNDNRVPIQQAVQDLAQSTSARIFVDDLASGRVMKPVAKELEPALDEIVRQVPGLVWRKVYLRKIIGAEPQPERVVNAVRNMLTIDLGGVIAVDSKTNTLASFVRDFPYPSGFEQGLGSMQPPFEDKPYYVVVNPKPRPVFDTDKGGAVDTYMNMQQQMLGLLNKMSPEERQKAMQAGMQMWMQMDPSLRNQMMLEGMRMSFEMWQQMSPDQRQQMMEMGRKMFEDFMSGRN